MSDLDMMLDRHITQEYASWQEEEEHDDYDDLSEWELIETLEDRDKELNDAYGRLWVAQITIKDLEENVATLQRDIEWKDSLIKDLKEYAGFLQEEKK